MIYDDGVEYNGDIYAQTMKPHGNGKITLRISHGCEPIGVARFMSPVTALRVMPLMNHHRRLGSFNAVSSINFFNAVSSAQVVFLVPVEKIVALHGQAAVWTCDYLRFLLALPDRPPCCGSYGQCNLRRSHAQCFLRSNFKLQLPAHGSR